MSITIDHFIFGVPDLEVARQWFHNKTGVLPAYGGQHPALGTRNALASLGDAYFEILAVDPSLGVKENLIASKVRQLARPQLIGWALQIDSFESVKAPLGVANLDLSEVGLGSRLTPDGETLGYRYATIQGQDESNCAVPFFLKWDHGVHPSKTAPKGCQLTNVSLTHLPSPGLRSMFQVLKLPVDQKEGSENLIQIEMSTPKGKVII